MLRVAHSMEMLGEPWPDVQDAYLRAWEIRPTRAEPLYALARRYANEKRHQLGYLYAVRAAEIPPPEDDMIVPHPDIYTWRSAEVKAICAIYIGKQARGVHADRRLLARPDVPDGDRQRIARKRDLSVPTMLEAVSSYPDVLARNLIAGPRDAEVTVSLIAGPDRAATEQTLNSFLHCCTDVSRVGRFLMIDAGLSAQDRASTAKGLQVPRIHRLQPRERTSRSAQGAPRPDRRTVLAASGPRLAVFRPRKFDHPSHRGARRRNTGVPGGN